MSFSETLCLPNNDQFLIVRLARLPTCFITINILIITLYKNAVLSQTPIKDSVTEINKKKWKYFRVNVPLKQRHKNRLEE